MIGDSSEINTNDQIPPSTSTRQSTATRRWLAAAHASAAMIAEITMCPPELAEAMEQSRHAPRLDSRNRHGKVALIWPYKTRQTGRHHQLSAIYLHT